MILICSEHFFLLCWLHLFLQSSQHSMVMNNQTAVALMQLVTFGTRIFEKEKYWLLLKFGEIQVSPIPGDTEVLFGCAEQNRKG